MYFYLVNKQIQYMHSVNYCKNLFSYLKSEITFFQNLLLVKCLPRLAFAWINVLSVHSTYHKLIYRTAYLSNSYESVLLRFSFINVLLVFATKIVMKKFHGKTMMVHNLFSESRLQTLILSSVVYGSVYRLLLELLISSQILMSSKFCLFSLNNSVIICNFYLCYNNQIK